MVKCFKSKGLMALVMVLGFGAFACMHQTVVQKPQTPEMFWPHSPETRRIQLLNTISGPRDLNIKPGFFTKVYRSVVGINETNIVTPYGVTEDGQGRLYVVDTHLKRVHVFDVKANTHHAFPENGDLFSSPVDVAVDDQRNLVYVTDSKQGLVRKFKDAGRYKEEPFGRGLFKRPTGIAVNSATSELLVVDTLQARVFRFDLSSLEPKGSFGGYGHTKGRFHYPTHIFVMVDGCILVSDSLNFRAQIFSPEGEFRQSLGSMGRTPGTFSRPKGVASDSDGNIYVVDSLFDNIQVFDPRGRLLMAFGEHGTGLGAFGLPTGIYIDSKDVIYVSDSSNRRVQVFQYLKE